MVDMVTILYSCQYIYIHIYTCTLGLLFCKSPSYFSALIFKAAVLTNQIKNSVILLYMLWLFGRQFNYLLNLRMLI